MRLPSCIYNGWKISNKIEFLWSSQTLVQCGRLAVHHHQNLSTVQSINDKTTPHYNIPTWHTKIAYRDTILHTTVLCQSNITYNSTISKNHNVHSSSQLAKKKSIIQKHRKPPLSIFFVLRTEKEKEGSSSFHLLASKKHGDFPWLRVSMSNACRTPTLLGTLMSMPKIQIAQRNLVSLRW